MKKRITYLMAAFTLLAFLAIPMGMKGQTSVTWPGTTALPGSATAVANDQNVTIMVSSTNTYSNPIRIYANTTVTISALNNAKILSVAYEASSTGAYVTNAQNATVTPNVTPTVSGKIVTWTYAESANVTEFTFKPSAQTRCNGITITYITPGTGPTVATPTFSPVGGTYTEAQTVSISCETQGTTIYYTLDGGAPDDESTQYTTPITVSETKTIKAIAYDSNDNTSNVASATYTIVTPMTIAEVRAQGTGDVVTTGTVTSCAGTTGYIQDATAAICVYGTSLTVGDNISVLGTLSTYNGLLEITNPQVTVISSGNTINPELMTIAQVVASTNQGWYIRIEDATVTAINDKNVTIAQGDDNVVVRFANTSDITFQVNHIISLNGNIGAFNGVQIANPQNVTVQENPNPYISAENVSIASDATGGNIDFTIDNPVTGGVTSAATNDQWLTLGTVGSATVPFTCTANTATTARTATVVLTYTYNRATVTKEVTVTQAAYEAPHVTWDLSIASYDEVTDPDLVTWSSNYATMTNATGTGSTSASNYLGGDANNRTSTRFYTNNVWTLSPAAGYAITSVVLTATSQNYANAFASSEWTNATASADGTTVTVTPTDGATDMVAIIGGTCGFSSVTVYYEVNNAPSISANNVEIAYDVTSGTITYTITNGVEGGALTASTTDEWVFIGTVGNNVPFTCSVNEAGTERTATVTLTYTYNRATVTKNVTITQAGNPNATLMTIAEVRAQGTGNAATLGTVTSITGTSNKTAYIQDATAAIVVYGNFTATVGDEIRVSGTLSDFNGLLEITNPTVTIVSSGNTINPTLMTIAEINASTNQGWYIRIEEATVTEIDGQNTTIAQGDNTIVVRGISDVEYAVNDTLSLNGNIGYYNANQIAHPTNVEVQHNTVPTITIATNTINAPVEGTSGTVNVTYQNITELYPEVDFCDAEGNPATYSWFTAEIDEDNNVAYTVEANQGEARVAYFRVYATDDEGEDVFSDIVTVNQEAHVAPTYAELPFEYDGNGLGELPDGLTQNGLTEKYNNSPKMKFDDTGDWLLLQFNERPGALTFDIKGNTFSGGTFKVQTSEDGETYTDLATYTELGNTQSEEFTNLGENVRYIKWIYVEKSSGNVGLGNIVLQPYVAPQEYTLSVSSLSNVELFVFDASNESQAIIEGEGSAQVLNGTTIEISVSAIDGYVLESLMVDGANVTSQIDETGLYTFTMPTHDVTITATAIEFVAGNYVRITSLDQLTNGSKVIIAARHNATANSYYAMKNATSNKPEGTLFTSMTSGNDEVVASTITDDEDHYYWTVNVTENGYTFTNANGQVIGYTSGTNFATGGDNTVWTITRETAGENAMVAEYIGFVIRNGNTNTRAFAFNGSAFGAYATTNMTAAGYNFFLDFFVQTSASETVTQTVTLTSGWNWFSTYIAGEPTNLLQMLETSLGENGTVIKSKTISTDYYEDYGWYGDLDDEGLMSDQMYMIETSAACTVELEGMPINPAEVEITINHGWNWIGFPSAEPMSVADAFAGFQAADGDILKNKAVSTDYYEDFGWYGELETMEPGQGFMYYSNSQESKTLVLGSTSKTKHNAKPFKK